MSQGVLFCLRDWTWHCVTSGSPARSQQAWKVNAEVQVTTLRAMIVQLMALRATTQVLQQCGRCAQGGGGGVHLEGINGNASFIVMRCILNLKILCAFQSQIIVQEQP